MAYYGSGPGYGYGKRNDFAGGNPQQPPSAHPFSLYAIKSKRRREVSADVVYYDYDYGSGTAADQKKSEETTVAAPTQQAPERSYGYNNYPSNNQPSQQHYPVVQDQGSGYGYYPRSVGQPPNTQDSQHTDYNNYSGSGAVQERHQYPGQNQGSGYGYNYNYPGHGAVQPQQSSEKAFPVAQIPGVNQGYNYQGVKQNTESHYGNTVVQADGSHYGPPQFSSGPMLYGTNERPPDVPFKAAATAQTANSVGKQSFNTTVAAPGPAPTSNKAQASSSLPPVNYFEPPPSIRISDNKVSKPAPSTASHFKAAPQTDTSFLVKKSLNSVDYANYGQVDKPVASVQDYNKSDPQKTKPFLEQEPRPAELLCVEDGKVKVFTGIVTQLQDNFGMIGDDVFFQKSAVKGPCPKLGDRVLVEAEGVTAMPFKWNSKRVQIVNKDVNVNQISMNKVMESLGNTNAMKFAPPPPSISTTSGPDALRLSSPSTPPVVQLKSILKNSMARNPPPPPLISKAAKAIANAPNMEKYNPDSPEPVDFRSNSFPFPTTVFSDNGSGKTSSTPFGLSLPSVPLPPYRLQSSTEKMRSPSPRRSNRSPPPLRTRRSPSPRRRSSISPRRSSISPRRRSISPRRRRSPSPRRRRSRSISPRRRRSPSPRRRRSSSLRRRRRSSSPRSLRRSPSPRRRRRSSSSSIRSVSPRLPKGYKRSPSPKRRKRSRSPKKPEIKATLGELVLGAKPGDIPTPPSLVNPNSNDAVANAIQIASYLEVQKWRPPPQPICFPIRVPRPSLLPNPVHTNRPLVPYTTANQPLVPYTVSNQPLVPYPVSHQPLQQLNRPLVPYAIPSVLPNPLHKRNSSNMISISTGNAGNQEPPPPGVSDELLSGAGPSSSSSQPPPPGEDVLPKSHSGSTNSNKSNPLFKQQMVVTPMKKKEGNDSSILGQGKGISTQKTGTTTIDMNVPKNPFKRKSKLDIVQPLAYVVKSNANTRQGTITGGDKAPTHLNTHAISAGVEKALTELRKKVESEKLSKSKSSSSTKSDGKTKSSNERNVVTADKSKEKSREKSVEIVKHSKKGETDNANVDDSNCDNQSKIWVTDFRKICVVDIEAESQEDSAVNDTLHQTFLEEEQRLIKKGDWDELERLREEEDKRLRYNEEKRLRDLRSQESKLIRTGAPDSEIEEFKKINGAFETRWAEEQRLIKIREEEERQLKHDPEEFAARRFRRRLQIEKEKEQRREEYRRKVKLFKERQLRDKEGSRSGTPPRYESPPVRAHRRSRSRSISPSDRRVESRSRVEYRRRISESPPRNRRSRRVSYEAYRTARLQRSSRSRSRELEYEEFVERYDYDFSVSKSDSHDHASLSDEDPEIAIARAMEMVRRKQKELDERERQIEARLKDTDAFFARHEHEHRDDRVQRYAYGRSREDYSTRGRDGRH